MLQLMELCEELIISGAGVESADRQVVWAAKARLVLTAESSEPGLVLKVIQELQMRGSEKESNETLSQ